MTKKEIARLVYNNTQLSLVDSQEAVQATFEAISKLLVKFGRVELRGFGVFTVQKRAARKAHNPRTGEEVQVAEHETVVFKPSKLMKAEVQNRVPKKIRGRKLVKPAAKAAAPKVVAEPAKPAKAAKAAKAAKVVEKAAPAKTAKVAAKAAAKPAAKKCAKKAK